MSVPPIVQALGVAILATAAIALPLSGRGGRWRALPGWVAFWAFFAPLLVALSRVSRHVSIPILGLVMFAALREHFYLAPVRPQDRWAIWFAYGSIPLALYGASVANFGIFLAAVLLALFLILPTLLAAGAQPGYLDAMGRILLGMLVYVFCTGHLGFLVHAPTGQLELFGVLVLGAEGPQRLAGRPRQDQPILQPLLGVVAGLVLACGLGAWVGPWAGLTVTRGAVAGALVAASVLAGRMVTEAVTVDLTHAASASVVGRAAFLDRTMPAVYAAPLYYHYLHHLGP